MIAWLALEDGTWFEGCAAGAEGETTGEVVFNTSLTGYQEILTDPSYAGQIVTMTCPEIGNYGVAPQDVESRRPSVAGFVIRHESPIASNWRAAGTLRDYLVEHGIVAISEIDTRALTRRLRSRGVMRGVVATGPADPLGLVARARGIPSMEGAELVSAVTCENAWDGPDVIRGGSARPPAPPAGYPIFGGATSGPLDAGADDLLLAVPGADDAAGERPARSLRVAAYDFGIKWNIVRRLTAHGCDVRIFPASAPAADLLATRPDGVFLSNGPGDPAAVGYAVENVRRLVEAEVPLFGICLGHQILALALGARTFKLKFGHRGGNHPVKRLATGQVEITAQNHGFAVDPGSLPADAELTHVNLYDGTVEGFRHLRCPAFCVQYHPEASPGPHDSDYLFSQFVALMRETAGDK